MSDSASDDFGTLGPTTPLVPVKRKSARTTNETNPTVSGPSSKPASGGAKRRRNKANVVTLEHSDAEVSKSVDHNPAGEDVEGAQQTHGRKPSSRSAAAATNGKKAAKAKGKANPARKAALSPELVDVDDIQIIEADTITSHPAKNDKLSKELDRIRRRAADAESQVAALSKQLEESFHVQVTEREQLRDRYTEQLESEIRRLEELNKELNAKLDRSELWVRSGKSSVFHLVTQEAADEQKKSIEKELGQWKKLSKEKDEIIADKDGRIVQLEQMETDLRSELRAEIERSSALASKVSRNPPSTSRGRILDDNPKQVEVIKFYEDLTNLLIPNMKLLASKHSGPDEWIFTCIYTYVDVEDVKDTSFDDSNDSKAKSLNFTLHFCYDGDSEPKSVRYIPLQLDKEPPEFARRLGFLGKPFTFKREQLFLFFRTVYSNMAGEGQDDENESEQDGSEQLFNEEGAEDDDIQIIEQ